MEARTALLRGLALVLSGFATVAAADDEDQKDPSQWVGSRYLILSSFAYAPNFDKALPDEPATFAAVLDPTTGKVEQLHRIEETCNGPMGNQPTRPGCAARVAAEAAAYERALAPFRKAGALTDAVVARRAPASKVLVEVWSNEGPLEATRDDATSAFFSGAKGTGFRVRVAAPGRPIHEAPLPSDSPPEVRVFWAPDEQWVAVVSDAGALRLPRPFALPGIAKVDLLDAGLGAKSAALVATLKAAGWAPAHQAKAKAKREKSQVFVMKGFEEDGKAVATLLGLPADSVQPLTWPSPYAVTIAAAGE